MATKTAKKKADATIAPPGVGTAKAAPTPASAPIAAVVGGSSVAALLASKKVQTTPLAEKKGSAPEISRPDLDDDIHEFNVGSFTKKEGESQMDLYKPKLYAEGEKERLSLCVKDRKFYKGIVVGALTFKVGSFSILKQPKEDSKNPANSITSVQIDEMLVAAFGSLENARRYTEWKEEMRLKLEGKTQEEKVAMLTSLIEKKFNVEDLFEAVVVLKLREAGENVVLMEEYSLDATIPIKKEGAPDTLIKVRDAVLLLKSEKFGLLSQSNGSLTPNQEAMIRIGTEKAAAEKLAKEAVAKLAQMNAEAHRDLAVAASAKK